MAYTVQTAQWAIYKRIQIKESGNNGLHTVSTSGEGKRRGMLASALKEHNKMSHLGEHAMTHALYVFLYTSSFSWALWADRSSHPQ